MVYGCERPVPVVRFRQEIDETVLGRQRHVVVQGHVNNNEELHGNVVTMHRAVTSPLLADATAVQQDSMLVAGRDSNLSPKTFVAGSAKGVTNTNPFVFRSSSTSVELADNGSIVRV
ncbi:hypothetical protein ACOSP7_029444 [Xanthoceras sorbifolium]